nr:hypothetical protein [uncultured bacterium]
MIAITVDFDRGICQCGLHESWQHHAPITALAGTNRVEKPDNHRRKFLLERKSQVFINSLAVCV